MWVIERFAEGTRNTPPIYSVFDLLRDYFRSEVEAIRFMRDFAGIILKIPTMPAVERLAKDKQIADTLRGSPTTATVRRLANLHGVPMRSIAKSFSKHTGEGLNNARLRESR